MAQTVVDICNGALQKLGAASIISLTENSREAIQCRIAYDGARRTELRAHPWNFAIKRVVLAPDTEAPAFDYDYAFTIPGDCLKVLMPSDSYLDWVVEGRKILTNDGTSINLRYVSDITDTSQFDPLFYELLGTTMAINMCEAITNSSGKRQLLMAEQKDIVHAARKANAFEHVPAEPPEPSFLTARY